MNVNENTTCVYHRYLVGITLYTSTGAVFEYLRSSITRTNVIYNAQVDYVYLCSSDIILSDPLISIENLIKNLNRHSWTSQNYL